MGIKTDMSIIIKAEDLYKSFTTVKNVKLDVLRGISIEVEHEKISVIIGASGAGKSTLLHLLSGLDKPDSGKVFFDGKDIFRYGDEKLSKFRNQNIGFIFQFHHLLPEFTALENVAIPLMISGLSLNKSIERAKALLDSVGLTERLDHKPAELSGGEQQRVAVARALANNPKIIFADEPTGNLDSANSESIHKLLFELRDRLKITFIIVTHNPGLVKLADKVYEMKDGLISQK
ncbi:MAG: ABC transporter ATP-binding protein [Ignavibacteriaceae bacterium]|nr:ABC transporter ATP-binding protein [Ignavibacteriaceae bacterium]